MLRVGKLSVEIFGEQFELEFEDVFTLTTLGVGLFCGGINGTGSIGKSFSVAPRNVG